MYMSSAWLGTMVSSLNTCSFVLLGTNMPKIDCQQVQGTRSISGIVISPSSVINDPSIKNSRISFRLSRPSNRKLRLYFVCRDDPFQLCVHFFWYVFSGDIKGKWKLFSHFHVLGSMLISRPSSHKCSFLHEVLKLKRYQTQVDAF